MGANGPAGVDMVEAIERRTVRTIAWRVIPLLLLGLLIAYVDRINVGFAASAFHTQLHLSNTVFGFGSGLFYAGYFLFDVPSNLMLEKIGAHRWLSRIMIGWGVLAGAMLLVQGEKSFYLIRFLLGVGEAGFFPGVVFLIVVWFPRTYRTRVMGLFSAGFPLSSIIGGPVSSALLGLDGVMGLHGWQWMFLLEAAPAVLVGLALYFWLPDSPAEAPWLDADQKQWLARTLAAEPDRPVPSRLADTLKSFLHLRVLVMALTLFANISASVGLAVFLPQIVAGIGVGRMTIGWLTTLPALAGMAGLYVLGVAATRFGDRAMLLWSLMLSFTGLVVAARFGAGGASALGLAALSLAGFGIFGLKAPFWSLSPTVLAVSAAAGGIAWINSLGNLGGWFGPSMVGWMSDHLGGYEGGMYGLAAAQLIAAILVWLLLPKNGVPNT